VDKKSRGQGLGSAAMKALIAYADKNGKSIYLTPSKDFGASSVNRLKAFYKRFGFVENKGRNKDYRISGVMYRSPASTAKAVTEAVKPDPTFVAVARGENEHPEGHKKSDFDWKHVKAYPVKNLLHLMPGGAAGWKDWFEQEVKSKPGEWDKLSGTKEISDPVVVSPGHIWDGWHRVAAAVINNIATVPAVVGTKK